VNLATLVVGSFRVTGSELDLRGDDAWSFCLDQRQFGPARMLVVHADATGHHLGLSHCRRTDPPWYAMACCLEHFGPGPTAALVYHDEPVKWGPPPPEQLRAFELACQVAANYGVHLVDWFACDDAMYRSMRVAADPDGEWWNVPHG